MDQVVINSILRAILAYFLVMFLTRIMGRKIISQMTFFDFVVGVSLGSVTANLALGTRTTLFSSSSVLIIFALLTILTGYLHVKSFSVRKAVNSEPVTVIANGKINEANLKKTRLTLNELLMLMREKNIFNVGDVEFALFEHDGKLSVLPKSQNQPLTPSDLNLSTSYKGLTKDLIMDGEILEQNLTDAHLNQQWLMQQLKAQGINQVEEVFYAGLDTSGNLYVSKKNPYPFEEKGKYGIE